jgi:peptidyl-prolyl cis-trans isomerase-like 1
MAQNKGSVLLETTFGPITLELYWDHAPKSCKNFYELAKRGYYDNTIFHRLIKVPIECYTVTRFLFNFYCN